MKACVPAVHVLAGRDVTRRDDSADRAAQAVEVRIRSIFVVPGVHPADRLEGGQRDLEFVPRVLEAAPGDGAGREEVLGPGRLPLRGHHIGPHARV